MARSPLLGTERPDPHAAGHDDPAEPAAADDDGAQDGPVEDESADPVGDGRSDATLADRLSHRPGRPNPEPDPPDDGPPIPSNPDQPAPGGDDHDRQPGRDPAAGGRRLGAAQGMVIAA